MRLRCAEDKVTFFFFFFLINQKFYSTKNKTTQVEKEPWL